MSKPKEFRLIRKRVIREECYVMAMDWEHAERLGHEEVQEWEHLDSHDEVEVEASLCNSICGTEPECGNRFNISMYGKI